MFHPLTQADLPAIWERQQKLSTLSSEFDAFRLFAWLPLDRTELCDWRGQFVYRCQAQGETWYLAPAETEGFPELIRCLADFERAAGGSVLRILNTDRDLADYPEGFTATPRRDLFDYLYRAEDLHHFQGRHYAAKRNQIAQFTRNYRWRFEAVNERNVMDCYAVADQWNQLHEGALLPYERLAIERMLTLCEPYGQSAGLLYADDQPVAFAIGSHPRPALLDIVAEKALPCFTGAYAMIIRQYARHAYEIAPFQFINREEDMGLENLRNAKLQLKPVQMIEKTLMCLRLEP